LGKSLANDKIDRPTILLYGNEATKFRGKKQNSPLVEIALVLVRFNHVALTDLTHFRIFPRNLAPDFTLYFSEQPEMSSQ
jgi:hypothetical protein